MGENGIACADDARAKTNAAAIVLIIDEILHTRCRLHAQTTRSPSADCSCHAVYAGRAEFCEVRLQTSFNSAAARFHAYAHRSDVAAAFVRDRCRPDQYGLARPGEVR